MYYGKIVQDAYVFYFDLYQVTVENVAKLTLDMTVFSKADPRMVDVVTLENIPVDISTKRLLRKHKSLVQQYLEYEQALADEQDSAWLRRYRQERD